MWRNKEMMAFLYQNAALPVTYKERPLPLLQIIPARCREALKNGENGENLPDPKNQILT